MVERWPLHKTGLSIKQTGANIYEIGATCFGVPFCKTIRQCQRKRPFDSSIQKNIAYIEKYTYIYIFLVGLILGG